MKVGIAIVCCFLAPVVPPQVEVRHADTGTEAKETLALLTCVRDECSLVAGRRFGKPSKPVVSLELSSFRALSTVAYAKDARLPLQIDPPAERQAVSFAKIDGHFLGFVERQPPDERRRCHRREGRAGG